MNIREKAAQDPVEPREPGEPQNLGAPEFEDSPVMELLHEHVPLSLLMDLSSRSGPNSEAILDEEGTPDDAWWEQG